MVITSICIALFMSNETLADWMRNHLFLLYISLGVNLVSFLMIACSRKIARTVPTNYITLAVFTLSEAYLVSAVCINYPASTVIDAAILTAAMTTGLVIYAYKTKTDFTYCGAFLFVFALLMISMSIMMAIAGTILPSLLYSVMGVLLASLYIIYDVQMIFEGKHKRCLKLSSEEYIFAAMVLFVDVIYLFLKILEVLGKKD